IYNYYMKTRLFYFLTISKSIGGFLQLAAVVKVDVFYKVQQNLRVGVALKTVSFGHEILLYTCIIFDDAVVYQRKLARLRSVWVGIIVRWNTVRRPARMSDAYTCHLLYSFASFFQGGNFSGFFDDLYSIAQVEANTGTIIAAVF